MGKVFRLNNIQGNNNLQGWDIATQYDSQIKAIADPQGATANEEITSIPSPFARMDLTKTAFREVVDSKNMDGNSIHHKMVSDCLDVGQIFFNIARFRKKVKIVAWSPDTDLDDLLNGSEEQQILGNTLKMYLEQDAATYNFGLINGQNNGFHNIYMLVYIGGEQQNELEVIGATSPATVFFSNANDLSYLSKQISFGDDYPFDKDYNPLYKRDFEYVKWWFGLRNDLNNHKGIDSCPGLTTKSFSALFPEINDYLTQTYAKLNGAQKNEVTNATLTEDYEDLTIEADHVQDIVEIFGFSLRTQSSQTSTPKKSEFFIASTKYQQTGKHLPLALPVDTGNMYTNWQYTTAKWNSAIKVPTSVSEPLEERLLPGEGLKYPFLTLGDFLEDTVVVNTYPLSGQFYPKSVGGEGDWSFLLPLKKEFFEYFDVADLDEMLKVGKTSVGGGKRLTVSLTIPVQTLDGSKRHQIVYQKTYAGLATDDFHEEDKGYLTKDGRFTIAVYPFVKYKEGDEARWRVTYLNGSDKYDADKTQCYEVKSVPENGQSVILVPQVMNKPMKRNWDDTGRTIDGTSDVASTTFVYEKVKQPIDIIQLVIDTATGPVCGLAIPRYNGNTNNLNYTFAVDFGTSNTHIEWTAGSTDKTDSYQISQNNELIGVMNANLALKAPEMNRVILSDIIPSTIGGNDYSFPIRTVLSEKMGTDWHKATYAMSDANIPFTYEKLLIPRYNHLETDLKWSSDANAKKRVENYLRNIMLMIKSKVLVEGGKLENTKIIWFYPVSMGEDRVRQLKRQWRDIYAEYFNAETKALNENVIGMSESIAPYYYYGDDASMNRVSIDIGGGTTDVIISQKQKGPTCLTSFRFAANDLFDAKVEKNIFIYTYGKLIKDLLERNGLGALTQVYDSIEKEGKGSNLMNFLFSLKNNVAVEAKNIKIDVNQMMADSTDVKILFIIFYSAIMYHIARLMKVNDYEMPRHITFSGTGSKTLRVLVDVDSDIKILENYTKKIFEYVYDRNYHSDGLSIIANAKNPKEATCRGGIKQPKAQDPEDLENLRQVLISGDMLAKGDKFKIRELDANPKLKEDVLEDTKDFAKMLFKLDEDYPFSKKFGAISSDNFKNMKDLFSRDLSEYRDNTYQARKEELIQNEGGESSPVSETLFFYTIKGIMNAIGQYLIKK